MKSCPICGKTEWDYDVTNGTDTFCGCCHEKLMKSAKENHWAEYDVTVPGFVFKNMRHYYAALSYCTEV